MNDNINKIFKIIKDFENLLPWEFKKTGVIRCEQCSGSGLYNLDLMQYCNFCGGIGYVGFKKIDGKHVCRTCSGSGCGKCGRTGLVDWVEHAEGKDIIGNEKYI
jgi:RecJ-like exonuclease